MIAVSLPQPQASLLVTRRPCPMGFSDRYCDHDPDTHPMASRFIVTDEPRPDLIGQRIAIASTKRSPTDQDEVGDYTVWRNMASGEYVLANTEGTCDPLPLGHIVGSATVAACLPIVTLDPGGRPLRDDVELISARGDKAWRYHGGEPVEDISDQLPYNDWTPGRHALKLVDAAPCQERCPWCLGSAVEPSTDGKPCHTCGAHGRCDPTPAPGRIGWWEWEGS